MILGLAASAALAALLSKDSLQNGVAELSKAIVAVHEDNRSAAVRDLNLASVDFSHAQSSLGAWWTDPAAVVPGVSEQIKALRSVAGAGLKVSSAGLELNRALTAGKQLPHGAALIAMLSGLETTLSRAGSNLDSAEAQLLGARSSVLLPPISSRLDEAITKVSTAAHDDQIAGAGVVAAVQFLGSTPPVLTSSPCRPRPSHVPLAGSSAITASSPPMKERSALLGSELRPPLQTSGSVAARKLIAPADYVARYGQFDPQLRWANVPMSPDFPSVAEVIEGLYPQEGGFPVDGVISVDPFALADLLRATGSVVVRPWPVPITAYNAPAILLHYQYDDLNDTARNDFLSDVTETVWHRFVDGTLPDLATVIRDLRPAFANKDLLLASTSSRTENLFRQIGVAGSFSVPGQLGLLSPHHPEQRREQDRLVPPTLDRL